MIRLYNKAQLSGSVKPISIGKIRLFKESQIVQDTVDERRQAIIEDTWRLQEEAKKASSFGGLLKETFKPSNLLQAAKDAPGIVGRAIYGIGRETILHPLEVGKGVVESAILKPAAFLQKIGTFGLRGQQLENLIPEAEGEGEKVARAVGEFLGWLVPYSGIAKGAKIVLGGAKLAPRIQKFIPAISDAIGFLGTGQVLFDPKESESRIIQLRNDAILLGIFKVAGKAFKLLKNKTVSEKINVAVTDVKNGVKPVKEIQKEIDDVVKIIKKETGSTPKQLLQAEIKAEVKPKIKLQPKLKAIEEPLAKEARKFKTTDEFVKNNDLIFQGVGKGKKTAFYTDNIEVARGFAKSPGLKGTGEIKVARFSDLPKEARTFQRETADQIFTENVIKELEAKNLFNKPLNKKEYFSVLGEITRGTKELPTIATLKPTSQLTDIFKQATKVKPKPQIGKPSKVAKTLEARAIQQDLRKRGFQELAGFTPTTIKKQAQAMARLLKNKEKTLSVLEGTTPLPKGLNASTMIATLEKQAIKAKDGNLLARIARSPLVSGTSEAAQTLRLLQEREPFSALKAIDKIVKARETGLERRLKFKKPAELKSNIKKSIKKRIEKTQPKKDTWLALIDEIKC